jgi:hypothetical protein
MTPSRAKPKSLGPSRKEQQRMSEFVSFYRDPQNVRDITRPSMLG